MIEINRKLKIALQNINENKCPKCGKKMKRIDKYQWLCKCLKKITFVKDKKAPQSRGLI